jgi:N-acetylglutamate synthase-like GNAT family acetyltransferase
VKIRRASTSDVAAIRSLTHAVYAKWIPVIGRAPKPMTVDYDKAVVEHWIDLAEIDGALAGLIETIPNNDHVFVENVAVAIAMQGQGLATQLLQHAESLARKHGLPEVQLATNQAFTSNLNFYEKRGYELYETKPFVLGGIGCRFRKRVS